MALYEEDIKALESIVRNMYVKHGVLVEHIEFNWYVGGLVESKPLLLNSTHSAIHYITKND